MTRDEQTVFQSMYDSWRRNKAVHFHSAESLAPVYTALSLTIDVPAAFAGLTAHGIISEEAAGVYYLNRQGQAFGMRLFRY